MCGGGSCHVLAAVAVDLVVIFSKTIVKTAVPEDGNPPGALVLTKLVQWYRFEAGDEKSFFVIFLSLDLRLLICGALDYKNGLL